jgi:hypothetical protein
MFDQPRNPALRGAYHPWMATRFDLTFDAPDPARVWASRWISTSPRAR